MDRRLRARPVPLLLSLLVLVSGLALLGSSEDAPPTVPVSANPAPTDLPPGTAGMRYSLDREGGGLGAASSDALELDEETRNALRRDDAGLVSVTHEDGTVSVHLQGRFQSASVAHLGPDGTVTVCVDDPTAVDGAPTKPATKWEVQ